MELQSIGIANNYNFSATTLVCGGLKSSKAKNEKTLIDVSSLTSGIYVIVFENITSKVTQRFAIL